ncbi:MAG: hypothetical protein OQK56_02045 [Ignavibacteriaceae bacterium]|nr:hypothetical protein [Ignavibacteriaceae bacterium]
MMIKSLILIFLLFVVNLFPQSERYTKGAENGYAWLSMDDPSLMYSTSKENYLSSILDRFRITKEKHPEIASLTCKEDINKLSTEGKSNEISLNDVVTEMNDFYSVEDNLVIPIIFAYCYTIKKFAGANIEELSNYRNEVLLFCYE